MIIRPTFDPVVPAVLPSVGGGSLPWDTVPPEQGDVTALLTEAGEILQTEDNHNLLTES